MLKYLPIALSLLLLLAACKEEDAPEDLLSLEQMQHILMEFQLADAAVDRMSYTYEVRSERRDELHDAILVKYQVSREQFFESYRYYLEYPELYDTIYTRLIDSLNRMVPVEQERRAKTKN